MKYSPHTVVFLLTVCLTSGQTPDSLKIPEKLSRLRGSYNTAVDRVVTPLKKTYATELQRLKIEYTKAGNLEAALAVDAEIKNIEGKEGATKTKETNTCAFTDTIWRQKIGGDVEFKSDGSYTETSQYHKPLTGKWRRLTDTEVAVKRDDSTTWTFIILEDGTITRKENRTAVWQPLKKQTETEQ